jgi:hypothetical protein
LQPKKRLPPHHKNRQINGTFNPKSVYHLPK